MKYFVKAEAFNTITTVPEITRLRQNVEKQLAVIKSSGKLLYGGSLAGARALFFVLEIEKPIDIYNLLGSAIIDAFKIEAYPTMSFEELGEFFKKDTPQ